MHCDYLNITVPETDSDTVHGELLEVISTVGASAVYDGLFKLPTGGTFKTEEKRGFTMFGTSGDFLATLRSHGLFPTYLSAFAGLPHNVSQMHIAHDLPIDSPREIRRLYAKVQSDDGLRLTRKKLHPSSQVKKLTSPGGDGRETGTIYLGTRRAEVWAKVYDKQLERKQRANQDIPTTTRYELSVSGKAGASLRDAQDPEAIFWHFMSEVLPAPPDAPEWVKGGLGYSLPSKIALLPAEALKRLLENSAQLQQMFDLSERIGPHGYDYLLRQINERYQEHVRSSDQQGLGSASRHLNAVNGAAGS